MASSGEKRGTFVLSLARVSASVDEGRPGTYFFGLGNEAAGAECARAVEAAIAAVKNPSR